MLPPQLEQSSAAGSEVPCYPTQKVYPTIHRLPVTTNNGIITFPGRLATFEQILLMIVLRYVKDTRGQDFRHTVHSIRADNLLSNFLLLVIVVINAVTILSTLVISNLIEQKLVFNNVVQ